MKAKIITFALGSTFAIALLATGCAVHVTKVYDADHADYHVWTSDEVTFFNRWTIETHRVYRDFHKLSKREQREYWAWRHNQH